MFLWRQGLDGVRYELVLSCGDRTVLLEYVYLVEEKSVDVSSRR